MWPCTPWTVEPAGQAAAPADLDHVAELLGVGRLADDAGVDPLAARRAASRAPCFVPLTAAPSSSPVISRLIEPAKSRPRRRGSAAAAAAKAAIAPFMSTAPRPYSAPSRNDAGEGIERPGVGGAGRDHVGMAGKAEVRAVRRRGGHRDCAIARRTRRRRRRRQRGASVRRPSILRSDAPAATDASSSAARPSRRDARAAGSAAGGDAAAVVERARHALSPAAAR